MVKKNWDIVRKVRLCKWKSFNLTAQNWDHLFHKNLNFFALKQGSSKRVFANENWEHFYISLLLHLGVESFVLTQKNLPTVKEGVWNCLNFSSTLSSVAKSWTRHLSYLRLPVLVPVWPNNWELSNSLNERSVNGVQSRPVYIAIKVISRD